MQAGQRREKGHWEDFAVLAQALQPYLHPANSDQPGASGTLGQIEATSDQTPATLSQTKASVKQTDTTLRQTAPTGHHAAVGIGSIPECQIAAVHNCNGTVQSYQPQQSEGIRLTDSHAVIACDGTAQLSTKTALLQDAMAQHPLVSSQPGPVQLSSSLNSIECQSSAATSHASSHSTASQSQGSMTTSHASSHSTDLESQGMETRSHAGSHSRAGCHLRMPTQLELTKAGRLDLVHAIRNNGGFTAVADRLNVLPNTR